MPVCVCMGIGELLALGALGIFTLFGWLLGKKPHRHTGCCRIEDEE